MLITKKINTHKSKVLNSYAKPLKIKLLIHTLQTAPKPKLNTVTKTFFK